MLADCQPMRTKPTRLKRIMAGACAALAGCVAALMGEAFAFKPVPGLQPADMDAIIAEMQANALE